jgi:agmatinase
VDPLSIPADATTFSLGFRGISPEEVRDLEGSRLRSLLRAPEFPWCGAPRFADRPDLIRLADLLVVGVPTDAGSLSHNDCTAAPRSLRNFSANFALWFHAETLRTYGWYDFATQKAYGRDTVILDMGDVVLPRGWSSRNHFLLIERCFRELRHASAQCRIIAIGGDHSITLPLINGIYGSESIRPSSGQSYSGVTVLHVDAHQDCLEARGEDAYSELHCANVMGLVASCPYVDKVLHFGLRGMVPRKVGTPKKCIQLSSTDELNHELARSNLVHVSIDSDVFDPSIVSAVASPVPFGWMKSEVDEFFSVLRDAGRNVRSLDLVEVAPLRDQGGRSLHAVLFALLKWLGAICG